MFLVELLHLLLKIGFLVFEVYQDWYLGHKLAKFGVRVFGRD